MNKEQLGSPFILGAAFFFVLVVPCILWFIISAHFIATVLKEDREMKRNE